MPDFPGLAHVALTVKDIEVSRSVVSTVARR